VLVISCNKGNTPQLDHQVMLLVDKLPTSTTTTNVHFHVTWLGTPRVVTHFACHITFITLIGYKMTCYTYVSTLVCYTGNTRA
jgi:hypothetical protein